MGCKEDSTPPMNKTENIPSEKLPAILFFGDSLTEGLGLDSREESYPSLLEEKWQKKGYKYRMINAGLSGDTTSSGLTRLDWVLEQDFAIFVLELGANDMMRGLPPDLVEKNLIQIIQRVKDKNPSASILLIPMKPFPNLGLDYGKKFEKVYSHVSKKEKVPLTKFLLEGVAGSKELNQKDGVHPTKKGHEIMALNIFPDLEKVLRKKALQNQQ